MHPSPSPVPILHGGVARIDITPELGIPLAGSSSFRPAKVLLDPLLAKALVLDDGKRRIAIVTADIIGFERGFVDSLRQRAQAALGIGHLVCNGSHTHSGPECRRIFVPKEEPEAARLAEEYFGRLGDDLFQLLRDAVAKREPVTVSFGTGAAHFGINRRRMVDGQVQFMPNPAGYREPGVPVYAFADSAGRTLAVLFSYACHPTTRYKDWLSADFPGAAQRRIEAATGAVALYAQGPCGDIRPAVTTPDGLNWRTGLVEDVERFGAELADTVVATLGKGMTRLDPTPLQVRTVRAELPLEPLLPVGQRQLVRERLNDDVFFAIWEQELARQVTAGTLAPTVAMDCAWLELAPRHGILTFNHEVCSAYLPLIRPLAGERTFMPLAYCDADEAYIPTCAIRREGGYEGVIANYHFLLRGPFTEAVEETLLGALRKLWAEG